VEKGIASPGALAPFARIREILISPDSRVNSLLAQLDDVLSSSGPDALASQDDKD
jgi:hypothetical protein